MENIKKGYNFRIIALLIVIIFSFENTGNCAPETIYNKSNLRPSLLSNSVKIIDRFTEGEEALYYNQVREMLGQVEEADSDSDLEFYGESEANLFGNGKIVLSKKLYRQYKYGIQEEKLNAIQCITHEIAEAMIQVIQQEDTSRYSAIKDRALNHLVDLYEKFAGKIPDGYSGEVLANHIWATILEYRLMGIKAEAVKNNRLKAFLREGYKIIDTDRSPFKEEFNSLHYAKETALRGVNNGMRFYRVASRSTRRSFLGVTGAATLLTNMGCSSKETGYVLRSQMQQKNLAQWMKTAEQDFNLSMLEEARSAARGIDIQWEQTLWSFFARDIVEYERTIMSSKDTDKINAYLILKKVNSVLIPRGWIMVPAPKSKFALHFEIGVIDEQSKYRVSYKDDKGIETIQMFSLYRGSGLDLDTGKRSRLYYNEDDLMLDVVFGTRGSDFLAFIDREAIKSRCQRFYDSISLEVRDDTYTLPLPAPFLGYYREGLRLDGFISVEDMKFKDRSAFEQAVERQVLLHATAHVVNSSRYGIPKTDAGAESFSYLTEILFGPLRHTILIEILGFAIMTPAPSQMNSKQLLERDRFKNTAELLRREIRVGPTLKSLFEYSDSTVYAELLAALFKLRPRELEIVLRKTFEFAADANSAPRNWKIDLIESKIFEKSEGGHLPNNLNSSL